MRERWRTLSSVAAGTAAVGTAGRRRSAECPTTHPEVRVRLRRAAVSRQERARYHVMREFPETHRFPPQRHDALSTLHSDVLGTNTTRTIRTGTHTKSRANVLPPDGLGVAPRTGSTDIGKEVPLCTVAAIRERSSAGRGDAYRCGVASPGAAKQQTERRQPSYAAEHTEAAGRGSIRTAVAAAAAGAAGGATGAAPATATYCLLARLDRPRAGLAARWQAAATR
mmetsp:Transcript_25810/g.81860  ORF Transcript_25810/g.81860 Transcript_25810/m.81860 type:complete len:225 (+) Transcript_25810:455-1129(+)